MTDHDAQSQFPEIWVSAIAQYKQVTKHDLLQGRLQVSSPDALLVIIETGQNKFSEYRKQGQKIWDVLKPVLGLVDVLSETVSESFTLVSVAVITSATDKYLIALGPGQPACEGSICCCPSITEDVSANYDIIVDLFEELKGFIERLGVLNQQDISMPLKKIIIEILAQLLVTLAVTTKWMKQKRPAQYLRTLLRSDMQVRPAMERLTKLLNQASIMVNTFTSVKATEGLHILQVLRDDNLQTKIHTWLSPPDPSTNHNTALGRRQEGTGDWFVKNPAFLEWRQSPNSLLWIHGIRTFLRRQWQNNTVVRRSIDVEARKDFDVFRGSSTLVEALQCDAERPSSSTSTAIPFFYFDFNDPAKLAFRNLIHSLIVQLLFRSPGTPLLLKDLYMRNHEGKQEPKLDDLISVLKAMAAFFDHTYIILDALDKCTGTERAGILRFLAEIKS
ncbi:hypothetical protein HETIRDRAFT_322741 [Heterobasidion irregulare TC 32-1]|uniref:Uncharacterized protein n=1 Tax=Heterobasidion irregulare (strain TC 32-1) TaxID=747525 RepID=W4K3C0_HETIT|nr:uncharacterized protein HETIRDRAFT_322741 [Heterobasidion irregulare TC 32-1]ETW79576.1 hypothetical protein HETIRDRAFT_322741 [Heterobasidion irregulare TC 32-1]